jgi:hypothetical protein
LVSNSGTRLQKIYRSFAKNLHARPGTADGVNLHHLRAPSAAVGAPSSRKGGFSSQTKWYFSPNPSGTVMAQIIIAKP